MFINVCIFLFVKLLFCFNGYEYGYVYGNVIFLIVIYDVFNVLGVVVSMFISLLVCCIWWMCVVGLMFIMLLLKWM